MPRRWNAQQLRRLNSAAVIRFPPSRAFHRVPAFQTFPFEHPSRVQAFLPELFSDVCPQSNVAEPCAAANGSACHGSCYSGLDPSRPFVALSYVRCLLLRSTFAATAPRSAVAELGVVRRLRTRILSERKPNQTQMSKLPDAIPAYFQFHGTENRNESLVIIVHALPRVGEFVVHNEQLFEVVRVFHKTQQTSPYEQLPMAIANIVCRWHPELKENDDVSASEQQSIEEFLLRLPDSDT